MHITSTKKGFTLIELLVVVSIVSLISSIIVFSVTSARAKAEDVAKKSELYNLRTAVTAYKIDHNGKAPVVIGGTGGLVSDSDQPNFTATLAPLVTGGYMPLLTKPMGIFYYASSTGTGTDDVVVIGATLKTQLPTIVGGGGSCRPFTSASTTPTSEGRPGCVLLPDNNPPNISGYDYDCGGGVTYAPACADGIDNDGDGKKDFGQDPGCASILDNGESPDPATTTAFCANNAANSDYCLCI